MTAKRRKCWLASVVLIALVFAAFAFLSAPFRPVLLDSEGFTAYPTRLDPELRKELLLVLRDDGELAVSIGSWVFARRSMRPDFSISAKYTARAIQVVTEKTGSDYKAAFLAANKGRSELVWNSLGPFQEPENRE